MNRRQMTTRGHLNSRTIVTAVCLSLLSCGGDVAPSIDASNINTSGKEPLASTGRNKHQEPLASYNRQPSADSDQEPSALSKQELVNAQAIDWSDIAARFDGHKALQHIVAQTNFGPRSPSHPKVKAATLSYIEAYLKPLVTRIDRQSFSHRGLTGTNLRVQIAGSHGDAAERLLLGAHWDTRPHADRDADPTKRRLAVLGANDGASGVAVMLEIARVLQQQPARSAVDLLFFDLEDMGQIDGLPFSIGARAFVDAHPEYRVAGGAIVDMVCDKRLRIPREGYSAAQTPEVLNAIWQSASRQHASVFVDAPGVPIVDDHLPFLQAGIPVINLIHYPFPTSWHTTDDRVEHCSATNLRQVGRTLLDFVYHHPNAPERPVE